MESYIKKESIWDSLCVGDQEELFWQCDKESKKMEGKPIISGKFKYMDNEEKIKECELTLYKKYLCVKMENEGIMDLSYVKCLWVKESESKITGLSGIIFLKNGEEFEVYSKPD